MTGDIDLYEEVKGYLDQHMSVAQIALKIQYTRGGIYSMVRCPSWIKHFGAPYEIRLYDNAYHKRKPIHPQKLAYLVRKFGA